MSSHHHHHYKRDFDDNSNNSNDSREERRKKRRSRWGGDEQDKIVIPGLPTVIPGKLTKEQEEMYLLQLQIETISRRLRTGELGIPEDPEARSPSPEPIYNSDGKRLNTREFRVRKKLEDERHQLIAQMITLNPSYKAPIDYKPPQTKLSDKVLIPQEEYPDINFVGLLIGPRGNTLKSMEKDTGAKIIIRGKGSIKEGKIGRKDGQPLPGEDEPLHAFLTGSTEESIAAATRQINKIIKQAIELPENQNNLRRTQLRELALLNGTLRENDVLSKRFCSNCGSVEHRNWQCPEKTNLVNTMHCSRCNGKGHLEKDCKYVPENESEIQVSQSKIDEEYFSFMAELGGASPSLISNANNNSTSNSISNNTSSTTAADGGPLALTYTENNKSANNETNNASETNGTALLPTPTDTATDKKKVITWIQKQGVWKQVVQDAADETASTVSENEKQETTTTTADSLTATTTTSASNFATAADPYIAYYNAYLDQALAEGQDLQTAQQTATVNYNAWYQYYVVPAMAAMTPVAATTTTASEVGKYTAVPPPHQLTNQPPSGSIVSTASTIPTSSYGYGYQQPPPPPQ